MADPPRMDSPEDRGVARRQRKVRRRWLWLIALGTVVTVAVATALIKSSGSVSTGAVPTTRNTTAPQTLSGSESEATNDPVQAGGQPLPAITVAGNEILRDGDPWWFAGYNSFTWSGNCGRKGELMSEQQVDDWFASMRHDGHGAVRLFFFDGWNIDRLDAAVEAARRNNIYVTITVDNALKDCGEEKKDDAWFADGKKRAAYAAHLTDLLERYRGNTTIAWFEYFNEPGYSDGALREFYDEMGALAATVDPDRLFSSGTLAPYALGGNDNFRKIQESPGVDISSLHEYDFKDAESHLGPNALANSAGKPMIVGEFGIIDKGDSPQECAADIALREDRTQRKLAAYLGVPGYAGALAWAWQPGEPPDACDSPRLDEDTAVQDVLRTAMPVS